MTWRRKWHRQQLRPTRLRHCALKQKPTCTDRGRRVTDFDLVFGSITASVGTIGGLLWRAFSEGRTAKQAADGAKVTAEDVKRREGKVVAEAAERLRSAAQGVLESQNQELLELSQRVTNQDSHIARAHGEKDLAIRHMTDRERWTTDKWQSRPKTLLVLPAAIFPDVASVTSELRIVVYGSPLRLMILTCPHATRRATLKAKAHSHS